MAGQDGAGQVVEAGAAGGAAVALPVRLGVIPAVAADRGAPAARAADAVGPAVLAHQLVALRVFNQRRQVHQRRHERHRCSRADPSSTAHHARRYPPRPTTPKPDKSLHALSPTFPLSVTNGKVPAALIKGIIKTFWCPGMVG